MNTLGGYFVNNMNDAKCKKENIVLGKKYRISILTDRLVRLEYNKDGKFEDNPIKDCYFTCYMIKKEQKASKRKFSKFKFLFPPDVFDLVILWKTYWFPSSSTI